MCSTEKARYGEITKKDAFDVMNAFYAAGGNFIGTAPAYQNGESEEWIGEWMAPRGNRDETVVATKYTTPYQASHKDKVQSNSVGNGAKSMKLSLEASQKSPKQITSTCFTFTGGTTRRRYLS